MKCNAGGSCDRDVLYVMNEKAIIDQLTIASSSGDASFSYEKKYEFINDSLIQLSITKKEYEFDDEEGEDILVSDTTNFENYLISQSGKILEFKIEVIDGREYPQASIVLLKEKDIASLPKESLDLMRNEIFAAHGYAFKTTKWRSYFDSKDWYLAKHDNVDQLLNPIELQNIQTILKVSKSKK